VFCVTFRMLACCIHSIAILEMSGPSRLDVV
jgi:hypothetical protein